MRAAPPGGWPKSCPRLGTSLAAARAVSAGRPGHLPEPRDEGLAAGIVADDRVVQRPWRIEAGLTGHGFDLPCARQFAESVAAKVNLGNNVS